MLTKSCTDILKEAALAEEFQVTDYITDELKGKYSDCVKAMPIIPSKTVAYNCNMVPVFQNESAYFVEMDNVVKYMNSFEITDIKEAMENIAEANEIELEDMSLVIETREYMDSVIENAVQLSKLGDKSLLENCELSIKLINMLESEGINVCLLGEGKIGDFVKEKKDDIKKKLDAKKKEQEKKKKEKEKKDK